MIFRTILAFAFLGVLIFVVGFFLVCVLIWASILDFVYWLIYRGKHPDRKK